MEANRGAAEMAAEQSRKAMRDGNLARALKLAEKSERLYPNTTAKGLVGLIKSKMAEAEKAPSSQKPTSTTQPSPRQRKAASSTSSSTPSTPREFSQSDVDRAKKVLRAKDHYARLGVSRDTDDAAVKKAYRKLALQLHPDKNQAPGADEAFKAVGKAYEALKTDSKRRYYNMTGEEEPTEQPRGPRFRHGGGLTPEEIFAQVFGGRFPQDFTQRHHRQRQRDATYDEQPQGDAPRSQLFMMLLVMFVTFVVPSFISSFDEPMFSLRQQGSFRIERHLLRDNSVSYYVTDQFHQQFNEGTAYGRKRIRQLETQVEQSFVRRLDEQCQQQRNTRNTAMRRARWASNANQAMEQAKEMDLTACERLRNFLGHRG